MGGTKEKKKKNRSLRVEVVLGFVAIALLMIVPITLISGILFLGFASNNADESMMSLINLSERIVEKHKEVFTSDNLPEEEAVLRDELQDVIDNTIVTDVLVMQNQGEEYRCEFAVTERMSPDDFEGNIFTKTELFDSYYLEREDTDQIKSAVFPYDESDIQLDKRRIGGEHRLLSFQIEEKTYHLFVFYAAFNIAEEIVKLMLWIMAESAIILLISLTIVGFVSLHLLVKPVRDMAAAAECLNSAESLEMPPEERFGRHLFEKVNVKNKDEIGILYESLSSMEGALAEYVSDLVKVTSERERIGAELSVARQIQADMLPQKFPAFPDRTEFDIFASMTPAREVGGDFYDFFFVDEDHLAIVIADVSDKGIPAALFMMLSKSLIQTYTLSGNSPKEVLKAVNLKLCENNTKKMFVTVWIGILEISTGRLVAANAGHENPVIMHPGGDFEEFKDKHGFVLGGMARMKYNEYELQMEPGSKLFVYTDGVPEATNAGEELFGMKRTIESVNSAKNETPEVILEMVHEAVNAFVGEAVQFDDLTMLCVEYKGA